jgi:hypothetical protein
MPSRSNAPPSGRATSSNRPPAAGVFTAEAQGVPPQRVLVPDWQLGHEVHLRVEQVRAGLAAVEVGHGARLHPRRRMSHAPAREPAGRGRAGCAGARRLSLRRGPSGSLIPPDPVVRFLLTTDASIRGFWSAPSHRLGVDAFIGRLAFDALTALSDPSGHGSVLGTAPVAGTASAEWGPRPSSKPSSRRCAGDSVLWRPLTLRWPGTLLEDSDGGCLTGAPVLVGDRLQVRRWISLYTRGWRSVRRLNRCRQAFSPQDAQAAS